MPAADLADLPGRRLALLNVLWFATNFQTAALLPVVVPAQILLFVTPGTVGSAAQASYLGWLGAAAALVSIAVQPTVGLLSDRTASPLGRRRPHIVWGTAVQMLGAAGLIWAGSPWIFALFLLVLQVGNNAAQAAYQGLFADLVPARQRGAASGFFGLMTILGNAASFGLALALLGSATAARPQALDRGAAAYYLVTLLALAATCGLLTATVREPPAAAPAGEPGGARALLARWTRPWRHRNYTWVFIARFSFIVGLTLFLTFIEYYFARVAHVSSYVQATAAVALIALLVAVASSIGLGVLSDRLRRVPLAFAATLTMAGAALLFLLAGGSIPLWALGGIFGLGYGGYFSVDWALAVDSLPSIHTAGRDLGLWNLSGAVAGMIAPALGAAIVGAAAAAGHTEAGYQGTFAAAALAFLVAAVAILGVREDRAAGSAGTAGDPAA
ncbi:MAG TPA: MFS transporter [Candidatus Dormibacteraeota bacterium]|nr:MFS transporter [Candidatus Dormibacteraeota bacterium]